MTSPDSTLRSAIANKDSLNSYKPRDCQLKHLRSGGATNTAAVSGLQATQETNGQNRLKISKAATGVNVSLRDLLSPNF